MTGKHDARVDAVFNALSDPTRRAVVRALAQQPASASELARQFPVSRQAVSKHLNLLDAAGLVTPVRDGRETRYTLTPGGFTDAMSWMADVGARWDTRLDALRSHLARGRRPPRGDDG